MAIKIAGTEVISDDKRILNNESLPDIRPSLLLDFANSKTLDPRITFTRGSTATYYDGKTTTKAEENLLRHSQDWTNSAWGGTATTITGDNTTAPDGTTTADRMNITSSNNYAGTAQRVTASPSTVYTASMYFKKANYDYMNFAMQAITSGGSYITNFATIKIDLSDGSENGSGTGTVSITSVGNGWYRVVVSGTTPSNTGKINVRTEFTDSSGQAAPSPSVAIGSQVYLWGAQLEQRSSATAYTPTTTAPIVKYQPVLQTAASGEARFDHNPTTGESKGLLIEEARTNEYTVSVPGGLTKATLTTNTVIAPDGTLTAAKLSEDTQYGTHYAKLNTNIPSDAVYTLSFFVKAAERTNAQIWFGGADQSPQYRTNFNLTDGTFTEVSSGADGFTMEDVGNGWYRCSMSATANASTTFAPIIALANDSAEYQYTGDGYSGIYVWGAQLEAGSFPTSYIPTSGSTVTRAGDLAYIANLENVISTQDSTFYTEARSPIAYMPLSDGNHALAVITTSDFLATDYSYLVRQYPATSPNGVLDGYGIVNGGSSQFDFDGNTTHPPDTDFKVAVGLKENDFAFYYDGTFGGNDTSGLWSNFGRLYIGSSTTAPDNCWNSTIKKIAFYPKRLLNATLQAMTEA